MGQSALYFDVIEQTAVTRFYDHLPHHPNCGDDKPAYLIRSKYHAKKYPYIQANAPTMASWLIFDIDHGDCGTWIDEGLPPPNLIVRDKTTGRGHISYAIVPVCTGKNGKSHPKRYLKAVRLALAKRLGADIGYTGRITKNPMSDHWAVTSLHPHEYSLGELADYLDLESPKIEFVAPDEQLEPGRNSILFLRLRYWAYANIAHAREGSFRQWETRVHNQALAFNTFSTTPYKTQGALPSKEALATAKSVAKWVWDNYTTNKGVMNLTSLDIPLEARQRLSARRTHEIRSNRTEQAITDAIATLKADGKATTKAAVARLTGITRQQISARYGHLFDESAANTAPTLDAPSGHPECVNFGSNQISAPRAGLYVVPCKPLPHFKQTGDKHMTNDANDSQRGGAAAFKVICGTLAVFEKINSSDGVTPKFGYNDRARLTRVILGQAIPLQDAELLAGDIAVMAVNPKYAHMTIKEWCAYAITSCRELKQKSISKMAQKFVKFDAFLNGEHVNLTDSELSELAVYAREKEKQQGN